MALFRRKTAKVVRRGVGNAPTEEHSTRKVGLRTVQVRRVRQPAKNLNTTPRGGRSRQSGKHRASAGHPRQSKAATRGKHRARSRSEPQSRAPDTSALRKKGKEQMLIRVLPHQTQAVVLEGPRLVEHFVHRSGMESLVGNIYLGQVKSVLPGLEAAFVNIGAERNGILYAADVIATSKNAHKGSRIEQLLKEGEQVVVQVNKDAMGSKGPRLTTQVALSGRLLVLLPFDETVGITRWLPDQERNRLRNIVEAVRPPGQGVIVRTAAQNASREELRQEVDRLEKQWRAINNRTGGNPPQVLHRESSILIRVIREQFTDNFSRLLIDNREGFKEVVDYLQEFAPQLADKAKLWEAPDEETGLFERFRVDDQLRRALERKVWLPSGGYLIIDRTEALTVIDVNTGKFVGNSNLEETVLQNNLEAAEEIGRQLRLRDIGGIIVIDFIDMAKTRHQDAVLQRLRKTLALDKTTSQVHEVSTLGLVEMSRKNVSSGLVEAFSETCSTCEGRGVLLHETAATSGTPIRPS